MIRIEEHFSLLPCNTFKLDVKARWFIEYGNEEELSKILSDEYFHTLPHIHIGGGSNILFLNNTYNGAVLHSAIRGITVESEDKTNGNVSLRVGAGEPWDNVAQYAVENNLYGIENLSGIPGETGGAAVQNIGAYGMELSNTVENVEYLDMDTGKKHIIPGHACEYGYRTSRFKEGDGRTIIVAVRIKLQPQGTLLPYGKLNARTDNMTLKDMRNHILETRHNSLPDTNTQGNAGCFFINPVVDSHTAERLTKENPSIPLHNLPDGKSKLSAAWLIEQCGFKGIRRGNAGISDKHALVAVNLGGASGREIATLAEDIRQKTLERFHVNLKTEVVYIE